MRRDAPKSESSEEPSGPEREGSDAVDLARAFPPDPSDPAGAAEVEPLLEGVRTAVRRAHAGRAETPADTALLAAVKAAAYLLERERFTEARELLEDAFGLASDARDEGRLDEAFLAVVAADQLAAAAQASEGPERAREVSERAERWAREVLDPADPRLAMILNNAGSLLKQQGDFLAAEVQFRRVLELAEAHHEVPGPLSATACLNLSDVLRARGRTDEAVEAAARAAREVETIRGTFHPETADALDNLASVLEAAGDVESARDRWR
ncbi:MAG: tetratricopeptide repeat protein, partial [Gemmatimonadota bacterium]|nr:tetratricopeptide repeat protein [Gemmatimonadota bacterium]